MNADGKFLRTTFIMFLVVWTSFAKSQLTVEADFKDLQSEAKTNEAASRIIKSARDDFRVREYVSQHLPALIGAQPSKRQVWLSYVRLAGALRISEAIPQLVQFISSETESAPGTLSSMNRLEGFPCATALVQIGSPAVRALRDLLERGDSHQKWFAYRCLYLIGSPQATKALRLHLQHESDQEFKAEMQRALNSGHS